MNMLILTHILESDKNADIIVGEIINGGEICGGGRQISLFKDWQ